MKKVRIMGLLTKIWNELFIFRKTNVIRNIASWEAVFIAKLFVTDKCIILVLTFLSFSAFVLSSAAV